MLTFHGQIDDLEKEWTWSQPFDFIFSRMMTGSFSDNADIVQKAFEYVRIISRSPYSFCSALVGMFDMN
jgi:hypothetical protein